ncbi:MAG: GNAT family protein [Eubacteriales bacterium]|nr:GNAT family protein [Eubacteriales bacterium]
MKIVYKNIILRDMRIEDIEDDIRWQTSEKEWMLWDEPWAEPDPLEDIEEMRKSKYAEFLEIEQLKAESSFRWSLEIDYADGTHIGSLDSYLINSSYQRVRRQELLAGEEFYYALGIAIYEPAYWSKGLGTQALTAYIKHHFEHQHNPLFLQSWSGNERMLRSAEKLGFKIIERKPEYREVRGKLYDALTLALEQSDFRAL